MGERLLIVCLALIIFGVLYNQVISWTKQGGYLEGFTWLAVVVGVAVTLGAVVSAFWLWFLKGWEWGIVMLAGFAASGLPMAAGAIWRYVRARQAEIEALRKDVE